MAEICTDNRFELIEKFKKELIEATNIETSQEEMKVLDNILFRFWQMGWLESIDRMPLVKESAKTLIRSVGDSVSAKAFRNAGRFIQNAIDGEAPEFEKIPSAQPEQLEKCPIYGGVCLHPSDQCYACPRHAGAEQIIRCTNCRFFKRNIPCTGGRYNGCEMWLDDGNEIRVMTDDYCSKALPKEGEQDDEQASANNN